MRGVVTIAALLIGLTIGYTAAIVTGSPAVVEPSETPVPGPVVASTGGSATEQVVATTATPAVTTAAPEPAVHTYLVWSTGGLTSALTEGLSELFADVSIVKGDVVQLEAEHGAAIPLDALAIDPAAHVPFDPSGSLAALRPGTVVLGETSADLRRTAVGDVLVLAGTPYEIVGIAPDAVVSAAEVVFAKSDPTLPLVTDRFALVATDVARTEFEEAVRSLYDGPAALRVRAEGETPWLRHGDAVLPQVFIKQALGEFAYTARSGSDFVQGQAFLDEQIVAVDVPILGEAVCHEVVAEMLSNAMSQLVAEGLGHLVDPAGFAGCWNPRFIRSATGTPSGVSRHSWGAAVDINAPSNPIGSVGTQDPRLVQIMLEWGFTWGGDWLVPDPMHFEYGSVPG